MYRIPDNTDWSFLVGRELLQVCIGLYQVSLKFDAEVSINIECSFDHLAARSSLSLGSSLPERATSLVSLLGKKIAGATSRDGKTLSITFLNSETLEIHDSNDSFESFQVIAAGREIIV